jgi:hypothetical protein
MSTIRCALKVKERSSDKVNGPWIRTLTPAVWQSSGYPFFLHSRRSSAAANVFQRFLGGFGPHKGHLHRESGRARITWRSAPQAGPHSLTTAAARRFAWKVRPAPRLLLATRAVGREGSSVGPACKERRFAGRSSARPRQGLPAERAVQVKVAFGFSVCNLRSSVRQHVRQHRRAPGAKPDGVRGVNRSQERATVFDLTGC